MVMAGAGFALLVLVLVGGVSVSRMVMAGAGFARGVVVGMGLWCGLGRAGQQQGGEGKGGNELHFHCAWERYWSFTCMFMSSPRQSR